MLAAAEAAHVKHMIQFTNRGLPHYRYLKQVLDDGYVGHPYHAYFHWPQVGSRPRRATPITGSSTLGEPRGR